MSIAEDLRRDADDALNDGGMYYSGEFLSGIAKKVEEVEAENEKLRELIACIPKCWEDDCDTCPMAGGDITVYGATECMAEERLREFGIEVSE